MKKRMLSTLLTLGMLLTLTPAVSAEVPEGSAGDIPEETCKVEYKEQSDGIEIQTEKDSNNIIHLDITINETAPSNVVLDFSSVIQEAENITYMPGAIQKFKVHIKNQSGKNYQYKDGSFVLSTADTNDFGTLEEGALLPFLGYDGQYIPITAVGSMLPQYFYQDLFRKASSAAVTFEEMCQIFDNLEEKGYEGENPLDSYMLEYLNKELKTDCESMEELYLEKPKEVSSILFSSGVTHNGIYTVNEQDLQKYISEYPWLNTYIYAQRSAQGNLNVQIKWPSEVLAKISYDHWYQRLFQFAFGQENIEKLKTNTADDPFTNAHDVADYTMNEETYGEANEYFKDLLYADALNSNEETVFDMAFALNGPLMGNVYQNYSFSWYNVIELEEIEPVTITPADITIYTGGESYDSVVNGSGNEIGAVNNGLPTPGFYIDLPESVNAWLLEHVDKENIITTESGKQIVDLSKFLTFTYNYAGETRTWELERYDTHDNENNSTAYDRFIYRIKPAVVENQEIPIRLQFTDENGMFMTSDDFTVDLEDLFHEYDMTIYSGDLETQKVKAVLRVGEQVVSYAAEVGEGKLTVRGVTDQNTATTEVVTEVPVEEVDNITAHVPEDTLFYINESQLEVAEPENVKLLVDSIVPDEDNTLYTKAVDGFEEITSEHNVKFNYLDLVDTGNGNAYVTTAGKPITVYWPYPAGTDKMDEFHIVHYEGLDRNDNTSLADGEYDMVLYSEENGNLENTDQGIRITVESFSPFALFWEEDSGGNGGHGGNGGNKPSLNTEDHYGYIVGYPVDYETGEPTDDQARKPVKPQGKITRAEVATIFFRMLTDESRNAYWSQSNSFTDVAEDAWYNNAISTMANAGILDGYEDGSFHPNGYITRAEFATIAVRFFDLSYQGEDLFPDIDGHWAQDYINQAADAGIIEGYPDGTFGPQKQITRAEAVTMVNRTLDRHPDPDHFLEDMLVWPDNLDTEAWYYADMQEATNSHEYQMKKDAQGNEYEVWTKILPIRDWEALEKEWSDANSSENPGDVV